MATPYIGTLDYDTTIELLEVQIVSYHEYANAMIEKGEAVGNGAEKKVKRTPGRIRKTHEKSQKKSMDSLTAFGLSCLCQWYGRTNVITGRRVR
jgi:hypothetical protein